MDQQLIDKLRAKVQACATAEEALAGYAAAPKRSVAQKEYLTRIRELVDPELMVRANSFCTTDEAWKEYASTPFDEAERSPSSNLACVMIFERWNDLDRAIAESKAATFESAGVAWAYYKDAYSGSNAESLYLARYNELNMSEAITSAEACNTAEEALEQYRYCKSDDLARPVFEKRWLELHLAE